jgi:hypothetical protein
MARYAKTTSQHLSGSLKQHPLLQNVLAHGERILHASRVYESVAPAALLRISRVANVKSGTLVIHADHGAAATKLKQLSRFLADEFSKRGFECTAIDIRVQAAPHAESTTPPRLKPLSKQALTIMQDAAEKLGKESSLRRSIERLIERAPHAPGPVKAE